MLRSIITAAALLEAAGKTNSEVVNPSVINVTSNNTQTKPPFDFDSDAHMRKLMEILGNPAEDANATNTANGDTATSSSDWYSMALGLVGAGVIANLGTQAAQATVRTVVPMIIEAANDRNNKNKDRWGTHWKEGTELVRAMREKKSSCCDKKACCCKKPGCCMRKFCASCAPAKAALSLLKKLADPKNNSFQKFYDQLECTDVDDKLGDVGYTPLLLGVKNHKDKAVLTVLDIMASLMKPNAHISRKKKLLEILDIKDNAKEDDKILKNNMLISAVKEGRTKVALRVLQMLKPLLSDKDKQAREAAFAFLKSTNDEGFTVLTMAAKHGDVEVVKAILNLATNERGERIPEIDHELLDLIDIRTKSNTTAFMWALGQTVTESRRDSENKLTTIEKRNEITICFDEFLNRMKKPNNPKPTEVPEDNSKLVKTVSKIIHIPHEDLEQLLNLLEMDPNNEKALVLIQKFNEVMDVQKARTVNNFDSGKGTTMDWALQRGGNEKKEQSEKDKQLSPEQLAKKQEEKEKLKQHELPFRIEMSDRLNDTSFNLLEAIVKIKIEILKIQWDALDADLANKRKLPVYDTNILAYGTKKLNVSIERQTEINTDDVKAAEKRSKHATDQLNKAEQELKNVKRDHSQLVLDRILQQTLTENAETKEIKSDRDTHLEEKQLRPFGLFENNEQRESKYSAHVEMSLLQKSPKNGDVSISVMDEKAERNALTKVTTRHRLGSTGKA